MAIKSPSASPECCSRSTSLISSSIRPDLIANLVRASRLYHQAETVKEAVYEYEGSFPGKDPRFACHACQEDDSMTLKEKVRSDITLQSVLVIH